MAQVEECLCKSEALSSNPNLFPPPHTLKKRKWGIFTSYFTNMVDFFPQGRNFETVKKNGNVKKVNVHNILL
jgi:hypothetical protein